MNFETESGISPPELTVPTVEQARSVGELALYAATLAGIENFQIREIPLTTTQQRIQSTLTRIIDQPSMQAEASTHRELAKDMGLMEAHWLGVKKYLCENSYLGVETTVEKGLRSVRVFISPEEIVASTGDVIVSNELVDHLASKLTEEQKLALPGLERRGEDRGEVAEPMKPSDIKREKLLLGLLDLPGFAIKGDRPLGQFRQSTRSKNNAEVSAINSTLRKKLGITETQTDQNNKINWLGLNVQKLIENYDQKFVTVAVMEKLIDGLKAKRHKLEPQNVTENDSTKEEVHKFLAKKMRAGGYQKRSGTMSFAFDVPGSKMFLKTYNRNSYVKQSDCAKLLMAIGLITKQDKEQFTSSLPLKKRFEILLNKGVAESKMMSDDEIHELKDWAKEQGYIRGRDWKIKLGVRAAEILDPLR